MKKMIFVLSTGFILILLSSVNVFAVWPAGVTKPASQHGFTKYVLGKYVTNGYDVYCMNYFQKDGVILKNPTTTKYLDVTVSMYVEQWNYNPTSSSPWYNYNYFSRNPGQGIMSGYDIVDTNMTIDGYNPDIYPDFDPKWGTNYNPLLKYWTLYKEVSNGKVYWNLMFTQFQNLKLSGNQIQYAGLGLWYRAENNQPAWILNQEYPTGSFIDGTIDTTIQTPVRSNHDIWDYTYTNIYFAKTDTAPTDNPGTPIQPVPKPVLELPTFDWTWDASDPWGSIGSFLTTALNYLKDLIVNSFNYLGDLLRYVFLNSSSSGIDFSPLIVSVSNLTGKFPFSIPWDFKNAITSLQATPDPPNWTINFDSRYFVGGGKITIDFSQFETLAAVSRWGILILFNISLILLSKKLIET